MTLYRNTSNGRIEMTSQEEAATRESWVIDPAEALTEARSNAVLSRAQFLQAVYKAGILTKSKAIAAAAGEVPAFFITALDALVTNGGLLQADADDAEILWAGLTQVERNHPFVPIAQGSLSLTDAQVDALFGIGV
jgi:hypothetical protein